MKTSCLSSVAICAFVLLLVGCRAPESSSKSSRNITLRASIDHDYNGWISIKLKNNGPNNVSFLLPDHLNNPVPDWVYAEFCAPEPIRNSGSFDSSGYMPLTNRKTRTSRWKGAHFGSNGGVIEEWPRITLPPGGEYKFGVSGTFLLSEAESYVEGYSDDCTVRIVVEVMASPSLEVVQVGAKDFPCSSFVKRISRN